MDKRLRLTGIDLIRGIAIFAVILLHADEGVQSLPSGWSLLIYVSNFAVPFFLAAAFYLSINKLYTSEQPYPFRARAARLLVPYLTWTSIYVLYKTLKYWVSNEPDKIAEVYHDPLSLLLGGAAFHLYFLPLLIAGTLLIKPLEALIKRKTNLRLLVVLSIGSLALYGWIWTTGNSFQIGTYTAFQPIVDAVFPGQATHPLLRLLLVSLAWMIRCAPYLFTAAVIAHPSAQNTLSSCLERGPVIWLILFLGINSVGAMVLPEFLYEVIQGYVALILAIALSKHLPKNKFIASLSVCSFGIYLMHLIVLETFQIFGNRFLPALVTQPSIVTLLGMSALTLLITWLVTSVLMRNKLTSQILLGS